MTARDDRLSLRTANRLKIGLFAANCSEGRAVTRAPDRWLASWPDNLRLAQLADAAGIDFLLPIGRWKGYGGATDHQGTTFETLTWASGLLAATERIAVFGTVHTAMFHPVIAAKQMVTADHIGQGRFGLNVVCGWNEGEFDMFGVTPRETTDRYAHGQEWIDLVRAIWERDDFDFEGAYFSLKGVRVKPKPCNGTRPFLMNAGISPQGRAFACRNCDALFTPMPVKTDPARVVREIAEVKALARTSGNAIEVYTTGQVTCRPTTREAEDYFRYALEENADWDAIDAIIALRGHGDVSAAERATLRRSYTNGLGGFALKGSPDEIAADFAKIADVGLAGVAISFINYLDEFPYFRDEVLPRLERLGLRLSVPTG
jgi:dimethylsulfone monooxygenase